MKLRRLTAGSVVKYVFLLLFLFVTIYPVYFVVIASVSDPYMVSAGQVFFIPKGLSIDGYRRIFEDDAVLVGYRNTLFYTVAGTFISLVVTLPAAYSLSRRDFVPRRPLMFLLVFTMYFSGGMVPTYLLIKGLGMWNTVWVMLFPFCLNVTNLIIARSYFEANIPQDLLDAAYIDGCNDFSFFFRIVLPVSKAIISVICLYYAVSKWNEYFTALIYLKDRQLFSLQLVVRDILIMNQSASASASSASSAVQIAEQVKYALIIVSTLPMLVIYPFIQKYFMKGVMVGAIKG